MRIAFLAVLVATLVFVMIAVPQTRGFREISLAELRDRIEGGWAGQMIGVSFGAPTEFRSNGKILEGELPKWTPGRVSNSINQDDLYVDMTFAKVLDDKGVDATVEDFGAMFRDAKYALWHANLASRRALKRGVPAALAGTPRYNAHANDIDFQIEADFIGLMAPGLPQSCNLIAERAGKVMNYGDGIYGGMFVSGMYAAAFFEKDPHKIVEAGLATMPAKSPYYMLIADVLAWHKQYPNDWKKVWQLIQDKWDKRDPCPAGALRPFNIDAKLNGAYIALGLLFGDGDFGKTIEISTRSGQDSDCNPASSGGILGVMLGYKAIPDLWKSGIPGIADQKFRYTDFTFRTIVDSTEKRAIALVKKTGGRVEGQKLIVKTQRPVAAKLAVWDDYGSPAERIASGDPRWQWKGTWRTNGSQRRGAEIQTRTASVKGDEATVSFEGTGAIVTGPYLSNGGKAEVYLDGKLHGTVDVYSDEEASKGEESVWHAFGLKNGKHTVRLVVLGTPYPGSKGSDVGIDDVVVFR
jgi:ADP-ribosylglycohydrolase